MWQVILCCTIIVVIVVVVCRGDDEGGGCHNQGSDCRGVPHQLCLRCIPDTQKELFR